MVSADYTQFISKEWYKSKGVRGGIVALLARGAAKFGLDMDVEFIDATLTEFLSVLGVAIALYGRVTARAIIK